MKLGKKVLLTFLFSIILLSIFNVGRVFASPDSLKITKVSISEKSQNVEGTINDYSDGEFSSNIKYHKLNDYVVYKVTLKNTDTKKHIIDLVVDNNTSDNLEYEYDSYKNTILNPNDEVDIYIKEVYRKENTDLSNRSKSNKVKFTFNLIDDEQKETIIDVIINPQTADDVMYSFIIAGGSLLVLALIAIKSKHKKSVKYIALCIALVLISIPLVSKAFESKDSIDINSSIGYYDKFKVVFNNGGETKNVYVKYNKKLDIMPDPVKENYKFIGWYNGDTKFDFETKITNDLYLTAKFVKITYNITFDYDNGFAVNPSLIKLSELPITLINPYKEGYKFVGWTGTNGDNPELAVKITSANSDQNYKANYEVINYEINYKGLNEEEKALLNNPETYNITDNITLNNPSDILDQNNEVVYKFIGWKDEEGTISLNVTINGETGNKTFEPIFKKMKSDSYSITYDLNGGYYPGESNIEEYNSNTETFTLNNPVKDGYEFIGWTGSNGIVPELTVTVHKGTAQDLSYTANFELINYQLTYNLDGGTAENPTTYTYLDVVNLNRPTKRGYTFTGWEGTSLSEKTLDVIIPLHSLGDREYTANFNIDNYNIDYILHGGELDPGKTNQLTYTVNDNFKLNNPHKTGYEFTGWTGSNGDTPQLDIIITNEINDKTYEANFTANTYNIIFDKNDDAATGEMQNQEFTYDEGKKLSKNTYLKSGYEFVGWTTNPDGTGTLYTDEEYVENLKESGNITLYAKWDKLVVANLIKGSDINNRMATLAGNLNNINKIKYSNTIPTEIMDGTHRISISTISDSPVFIWYESGTLYYGTEADVIYFNENSASMFANLKSVTEIDTIKFNTEKVTSMEQMFVNDFELATLDVSKFNTSNVTSLKSMFTQCRKMTSYDFSNWDVRKVKDFSHMFNSNHSVEEFDLTNWYTDSATNMRNMFSSTYVMTSLKIPNFNTSKVTNLHGFVNDSFAIETLDFSMLDTQKVTDFSGFISNDHALKNVIFPSNLNTSAATNMSTMFKNCENVEVLDLSMFNTSKVSNISNMFDGMTSLKTIYAGDGFVKTSLTSNPVIFDGDASLVGGNGTRYVDMVSNKTRLTYAVIDGENDQIGYFTRKTN